MVLQYKAYQYWYSLYLNQWVVRFSTTKRAVVTCSWWLKKHRAWLPCMYVPCSQRCLGQWNMGCKQMEATKELSSECPFLWESVWKFCSLNNLYLLVILSPPRLVHVQTPSILLPFTSLPQIWTVYSSTQIQFKKNQAIIEATEHQHFSQNFRSHGVWLSSCLRGKN